MSGAIDREWFTRLAPWQKENVLLSAIEEIRTQVLNRPKWILTSDCKPLTGAPCWVVYSGTVQQIAYRRVGIGFACSDGYEWESACDLDTDPIPDNEVTHWMPLPEAPTAQT